MTARLSSIVAALPATVPFVGPETLARRRGRPFRARLGANESCFGPSPRALEAMCRAAAESWQYGDSTSHELREVLAFRHGVAPDEILIGAGIDELLGVAVRMLIDPGDVVVSSKGAYPTFAYHVVGYGGRLEAVPYRDDHEDLAALAQAAHDHAAPLVYLSNPDNPMGSWHSADAVRAFRADLPGETWLVLDEAYAEFAPAGVLPPIDTAEPRTIRMRTFSKAHGLAGARIGYALAHRDVITATDKIRNHFGVNRIAQVGARASLEDEAHTGEVVAAVVQGREDYRALAERLGMRALPSATNFVAIDVAGAHGGPERARGLLRALEEQGIFVRMPGVAPLDRCIRVTVGTPEDRRLFAEVLEELVRCGH
ncbi:MAG: pyridoxal phosphate-dependent aminotransferase [Geminicoccaceae bacterium]|nr:pyridoxal phosphate-dependent aminotransferase [Geminicoccaceae bacterium]